MCGIVGFSGKNDSNKLQKMMQAIYHRGPDDFAKLEALNFSIGFRRLSIIDLSKNIYPIQNENGEISVFLNGEIYNYLTLREELIKAGHKFKTKSDTEVIVHGYEEWGEEVLSRLRGMFALVVYNSKTKEVFIARDRMGIKPFYYAEQEGRIIFSSEIKGILSGFDIERTPDDFVVYQFLSTRVHDIDKRTFFEKIKRLLPGHFMIIDKDSNFRIGKYWSPSFNPEFVSKKSDSEYANELREIFSEAVRLHMISDVPVGVTLSGGLDSSGVTSLASRIWKEQGQDKPFYTFSAIHPGETVNEEEYIDSVVEYTGVTSIKVTPNVEKFWEDLPLWNYFQEEPVISGAPYAYYVVMREARKYVTVLLTGQGGDELLAGYIPYFLSYLQSAIDQGKYIPALRELYKGKDLYLKYILMKFDSILHKKNQINPLNSLNKPDGYEMPFFKHKRNLNERLFEDVTSTTTPCLLRYEDKNSMANSLESRVPFFDHIVTEYIFNLPIDQKIKHGWTRYVYREAMKGLMPEKNRKRRSKIGFTNPEWEWIERKKENFFEIFRSESFKSRKYWNNKKVISDFELALKGKLRGDVLYFWRLFSVEMWLREYVDNFVLRDTSKLLLLK